MPSYARAISLVAVICSAALSGCAGSNLSPVANAAAGSEAVPLAPAPHYALPATAASRRAHPDFVYVPYLGGPIVEAPKFYFIFWGYKKYGDPDGMQKLLESYAQNMGGSAHNDIETQYYQTVNSEHTYITNPSNQYGGSWNDEAAVPKKPTDGQIGDESVKGVQHFGYDPNGVYFVMTAHGHSEEGFVTHWCSYHSFTYYKKKPVPYANLPYVPDGAHACGANWVKAPSDESAKDEGVTILAGHEFGESITDPQPYSAWSGPAGEVGDQCAWHNLDNEPFGKKSYTTQPMASDATESCVQSYPSS
jgi:hypothetical protein